MPRRSVPKTSPKIIAQAVKRHVEGGENADALAKEYEVSRASIYGWVAKYKQDVLERSRRDGMNPLDADRADKAELIAHIEALELENKRLRDRIIDMLLQTGATTPGVAALPVSKAALRGGQSRGKASLRERQRK